MAYTQFPVYAQWLMDGYSETDGGDVDRSEMSDGYIHQAPTNSLGRHQRQMTYRLASRADLDAFKHWRDVDLVNGARWFAWPDANDPSGQTLRRARIVSGEITYEALTAALEDWSATFVLEYWG